MYAYFVSFVVIRPISCYGNCDVTLNNRIKSMEDILAIEKMIIQKSYPDQNAAVTILSFQLLREEPGK